MDRDPAGFCEEVAPLLRGIKEEPGSKHILWLISGSSKVLVRILCDSSLLNDEEACSLAERLKTIEPSVEMNLVKEVFGPDGAGGASLAQPDYGLRYLTIFSANHSSMRLLPVVGKLLRHPNARIRSKAASMIGKLSRQYDWLEQTQHEKDDRVRANALEALWEPGIPERFRVRLWEAAKDPNNRVAGNALLGLYRQGECGCIPLITSMAKVEDENFRATAAWVIGETRDDRFRSFLVPLLVDSSALVRQNAKQAIQKVNEQKKFSNIEKLQVVAFPQRQSGVFPIGVALPQGAPAPALLPTDFRIEQGTLIVEHYTVRHQPLPETMSITFAVPGVDGAGNNLKTRWRAFFSQLFKQKRQLDFWAFLEYATGNSPANRNTSREDLQFVRNAIEFEDLFAPQLYPAKLPEFAASFESLLTLPPLADLRNVSRKGACHILLVESPTAGTIRAELLEKVISNGVNGGFTVHVISADPSSPLAALAAATGGTFLVCQREVESWQRALAVLYTSLFSTYNVEFDSAVTGDTKDAEIQIQVRKGPLFGEIRINPTVK